MMEAIQNGRNIDLNDDLIYEILRWVSLDTLERCRLASKKINEYTNLPWFLNPFYRRNDIFVGCMTQTLRRHSHHISFTPSSFYNHIVRDKKNPSLSLDFLPRCVKVKVCSNVGGLVYCRSTNVHGPSRSNYMCKPTTEEWVVIPNHKTRFKTEAYAVVMKTAQPLKYSIFRFSKSPTRDPSDYTMFCEIFDSTTWLWRRAKDVKFLKPTALVKKGSATYMKGVLHFLTCSQEIFAFNIATKTWELKPLPQQIVRKPDNNYRHILSQYRGKLRLDELTFHNEESEYRQTWEMADYSKATWTKGYCCLREGHTFALSYYDLSSRWFYQKSTIRSSYDEVKAGDSNSLYFTQMLTFVSDYEPVFLKPPTPPPPPPPPSASTEQIDQALTQKKRKKKKKKKKKNKRLLPLVQ